MLKKLPGITQILGLLGSTILPILLLVEVVNSTGRNEYYFAEIIFLIMPALACKLLFEGDESELGKFFYTIGEFSFKFFSLRFYKDLFDNVRKAIWLKEKLVGESKETYQNKKFLDKAEEDLKTGIK